MPFNVQQLNVDFCTGGVLKWLCGGPGTTYLYVRPDLAKTLEPRFPGCMGHRNPFGFEIGSNQYTDSIYRFTQGTPNIPALHAARPGLTIIAEAGIENIRQKSRRQTGLLIEMADRCDWRVNTARDIERRGGTISIDMPNAPKVCDELLKRDVLVDYRPQAGARFSPHFYNADEELTKAIATGMRFLVFGKIRALRNPHLESHGAFSRPRVENVMRLRVMRLPNAASNRWYTSTVDISPFLR